MTATDSSSWVEANQAFLVNEFDRLKARLGDRPKKHSEEAAPAIPLPPGSTAAIDWLANIFELTGFERDLLLLCAGVEMDSRLAALCGQARPAQVTFGMAMAVLNAPHWDALTPSRPLRRFRLVEVEERRGLATAPLCIDERVLHLLAGINVLDQRLERLGQLGPLPVWIANEHKAVAETVVQVLEGIRQPMPIFHFCGDDPQGQEDAAGLVSRQMGRQLFTLREEDLPGSGPVLDELETLWQRESLLLPGALLIQCGSAAPSSAVRRLAERLPGLLFVGSREPIRIDRGCMRFEVNKPQPAEQRVLWEKALGSGAANLSTAVDAVSAQFRLSARTIFSTANLIGKEETVPHTRDLWETCRSLTRPRLEGLAQRIASWAGWDDLVLPEGRKETLRQIASQVRHRMKVYETWGFSARGSRGLGVSALFTGESGTGKTMAAEVLARELELDLYRIDLSAVVSKYIGETEKNLKEVFDAAEEGGVLLLFDEADALFGKRSEVKDSHDRYANIEVSYLLQRMEAYQGLAILTTNLKSSMDRAFLRRIRFTVNFPFPDTKQREAIWSRVFPAQTPTNGLDSKRLSQLNVAGGNIRNIALNAAFLAAEEAGGTPVDMRHLLRAARLEAEKIERPLSEAETRGWV